jgi:hypothetical protein
MDLERRMVHMNWLSRIRKNRLLKRLGQVSRMPSNLRGRLSNLDVRHLQHIAEASKRIKQNDQSLAWAFSALLPRMVQDAGVATELAQADRHDLASILDKRIAESAKRIVDTLSKELDPAPPSGCSLNRNALVSVVIENMQKGKPEGEIGSALTAQIHDEPDRFLNGYMDWAKTQAEIVLIALEPTLKKSEPEGCSLDRAWCQKELLILLRKHRDMEALVKAFVKLVSESFSSAYQGYDAALKNHEDDAHNVWKRVEKKLPLTARGVVFNIQVIIRAIASKLMAGERSTEIESEMLAIVTAQLETHERLSAFRSGFPDSPSKSSSSGRAF